MPQLGLVRRSSQGKSCPRIEASRLNLRMGSNQGTPFSGIDRRSTEVHRKSEPHQSLRIDSPTRQGKQMRHGVGNRVLSNSQIQLGRHVEPDVEACMAQVVAGGFLGEVLYEVRAKTDTVNDTHQCIAR